MKGCGASGSSLIRRSVGAGLVLLVASFAWLAPGARGEDVKPPPKLTIKQIMEKAHKGRNSIVRRVQNGQGTPSEISQLLSYYKMMEDEKPPKGDPADWKSQIEALVQATQALKANEPGALGKFKSAVSCKACHSKFNPD